MKKHRNEEGFGQEWIYVKVPQTRLTKTDLEGEKEKNNQKSPKQFKYIKYMEMRVRMHGKCMNM